MKSSLSKALHTASRDENKEIVELLISGGADL